MNNPYFSIVIPTYNRAALVLEAVNSALQQQFVDYEIIVVDDGSKDTTEERLKLITDPRFSYYKKENGERGAARNFGTAVARGKYVNFFDSDDLMYSNHLQTAKELIDRENNPEFFHLGYDNKTRDGVLLKKVDNLDNSIQRRVLFSNFLGTTGVFVRKDIAAKHRFEESRVLATAEDWELWIRLLSRYTIRYSNTITSTVVNHPQRSIFTIPADKVIARDTFLVSVLEKDPEVMACFAESWKKFVAERYTFIMLCLAEERRRREVFHWARKALSVYLPIVVSRRFLASIKNAITK